MYTITSYDPVTGDITGINNTIGNTDLGDASNVYIGGGAPGEILSTDGAGNLSWIAPSAGSPNSISNGTTTVDIPDADGDVVVTASGGSPWTFGADGNLTLPADGLLVVSGGIVGGGASPAPYLSGFSSVTAQTLSASGNITAGNIDITGSNLNWSNASIVQTGNADINITGDGVVTLRSLDGVYQWTFDTDGILNAPGNIATSGNVSANYFIGDGSLLTGISASTGDITFVNTTISAPNGDDIVVQALNDDGVVGSSLEMSPNDTLIRLEQWSEQDSQSFTTADWATGVYTTQGGGSIGAVEFTGAATIVDFVNSLVGVGQIYFSVNGGPLLVWDGSSAGPTNITFLTPTLPDTDPTTVTSFEYFYSYKSGFEIDYDDQEITIYANDADIILETTGQRDISLNSSGDVDFIGNGTVSITNYGTTDGVFVTTDANDGLYQWNFGTTGNLTLPTISIGVGLDEQTVIQSQRKLIPSFRWSAVIDADTPTVVYTATNDLTRSMKVTIQIQHSGLGMELLDVFATYTGSDTFYTVSNRVAPPTVDASTLVVDLNVDNVMQVTVTINSGATTSWVTYDTVEFGIPND